MSEEEKKAITNLIDVVKFWKKNNVENSNDEILLNLIDKQQKEIEELKKVNKMVETYKSYGIPDNVEMVIMCKEDFLRNINKEFINTDKIKELINKRNAGIGYTSLECIEDIEKLLEE